MNWISVKDRLPVIPEKESAIDCIVFGTPTYDQSPENTFKCVPSIKDDFKVRIAYFDNYNGFHEPYYPDYMNLTVTHWMALPTSPKDKE